MWPSACLYLEESDLYVWRAKAARLEPVEDVAAFLRAGRRRNYRLVINQSREQVLPETLPALPRGALAQFLHRRLRRLFPDTPWRSVAPKTKRAAPADVTWLALSETPALRRLLAAFTDSGAALAGIYSVAQLLPLDLHAAPHLLLSEHCRHLRCSLIAGGSVRASQLLAATADSAQEIRQFLARTQQGSLPVILLGSQPWRDALALPAGVSPLPATPASLRPLLAGIRRWPREQFALPAQRTTARRRDLILASGLLSAFGLLSATVIYGWQPKSEPRQLQLPSPPLPSIPEEAPAALPVEEPAPPPEPLPQAQPRLDGRLSRQGAIVSEWRDGEATAPARPALAVGDSPEQTLLPPGSLRIHQTAAP